jgi:hypothetical protein
MSVAAAPFVSAAEQGSGGVALHVSGTTSGNWSGYADTQNVGYTFVEANWTEPSYTCDGNSPESSAIWVGLDGYSSSAVEQGGTIEICNGEKQATHEAWWEMYPTNTVQDVFAVKVGDKMFASVTYSAGKSKPYDIVVKDLTSGRSLNKLEACLSGLCERNSAEWIVESPSFSSGVAYLPKFAPIKFTNGFASDAVNGAHPVSIASFTHVPITMTGAQPKRAVPSALTSNGEGFTDKWVSSKP